MHLAGTRILLFGPPRMRALPTTPLQLQGSARAQLCTMRGCSPCLHCNRMSCGLAPKLTVGSCGVDVSHAYSALLCLSCIRVSRGCLTGCCIQFERMDVLFASCWHKHISFLGLQRGLKHFCFSWASKDGAQATGLPLAGSSECVGVACLHLASACYAPWLSKLTVDAWAFPSLIADTPNTQLLLNCCQISTPLAVFGLGCACGCRR